MKNWTLITVTKLSNVSHGCRLHKLGGNSNDTGYFDVELTGINYLDDHMVWQNMTRPVEIRHVKYNSRRTFNEPKELFKVYYAGKELADDYEELVPERFCRQPEFEIDIDDSKRKQFDGQTVWVNRNSRLPV